MATLSSWTLAPYLVLFAALYAGFGVQSPYLPAFLGEHGVQAETIGVGLAGATAIKLLAGPVAGRLADRFNAARLVFAGCAFGAALAALGYPGVRVLAVARHRPVAGRCAAPLAPLGDSLVLPVAAPGDRADRRGFDYGWVRGTGSGAFILGSLLSGEVVGQAGLGAAFWLNAGLLVAAALWALRVRPLPPFRPPAAPTPFAAGHVARRCAAGVPPGGADRRADPGQPRLNTASQ
jgi:PPP family 3-phenylpropionic acid transporter